MPEFKIGGEISFSILPFEVSHRYHLDARAIEYSRGQFIVSCSGNTRGYLLPPSQLCIGGYEVDRSRRVMKLKKRIQVKEINLW